jgi:hypothetical protein
MNPNKRQSSPATASQENIKRTRSDLVKVEDPTGIPPFHESELPLQVVVSKDQQEILDAFQTLIGPIDNNAGFKHPIIIGPRATSYWLPSFRSPDDWDLVATPQQAFDMINDMKKKRFTQSITHSTAFGKKCNQP